MRIAVLLPNASGPAARLEAYQVARLVRRGARLGGTEHRVILGVPASDRRDEHDVESLRDLAHSGVQVREFRTRSLEASALRALEAIGNRPARSFGDRGLCLRDGIADFYDCDVWILLSHTGVDDAGVAVPVVPMRPGFVMSPELIARARSCDDDAMLREWWAAVAARLDEVSDGR